MAVHITEAAEPLLTIYPQQQHPQAAYMQLELQTGEAYLGWNGEVGNAVPMDVWHGLTRRYTFSDVPRLSFANEILRAAIPLMERVLAGAEVVWDGSNNVARLTDDAADAETEMDALLEVDGEEQAAWADAYDWLPDDRADILDRLQAGETVDALYDELQGDGEDEQRPFLPNLDSYLRDLQARAALAKAKGG